ncbi:DNA polymerase III subunit delta [Alkalithermobacter thermoalcaliphilus]
MKKGVYHKLYLFYGKESYLLDNVIKVSKESLNESFLEFNFSIIDGKEINLQDLINAVETLPFMDEKKIIILKDFELIKGKKKLFSQEDEKKFIDYLENIPNTSIIIFIVYGDIDKKKSIVKTIQENGVVLNCDKLTGNELVKWVHKKFKENKIQINQTDLMYFLTIQDYENKNSSKTLSDLENEINKIAFFVGKDNKVTKEIIDKLSPRKIDNDIFRLIDAIEAKNATLAIKTLRDMILDGQSHFMILSMIARQFKIVLQCKELRMKGYSSKLISQKLGIHPYVATKALRYSQSFDDERLINILNDCLEIDFSIKNGLLNDTLALDVLITNLCT